MKFEIKVGVSETDKIFVQVYNLVDDLMRNIILANMEIFGGKSHMKMNEKR